MIYQPKTDCFGYKMRDCTVLDDLYCVKDGKCSFYKTKEQYKSDRLKYEGLAYERGEKK